MAGGCRTSLSCIRPAVSIRTTSKLFSRAMRGQFECVSPCRQTLGMHTVSDCFLRDPSSVLAVSAFVQFDAPFTVRCSINTEHPEIADVDAKLLYRAAPTTHYSSPYRSRTDVIRGGTYRNVSHAAMSTWKPFWINQKQTFDRLVLLPTPLTPTKVILYGTFC